MRLATLFLLLLSPILLLSAKPVQPEKPAIQKPGKLFPRHWGHPPKIQTRDMVDLPGKFGKGSSTLAKWIAHNLKKDTEKRKPEIGKPKPPVKPKPHPEPPTEVKEKIDEYKDMQKQLQLGLQEKLKSLGKKPSRELVRKTVDQFRKDNKDLFESQKETGKVIQEWQKENRPERPKRPEPTVDVKEKIAIVIAKEKEMNSIRKDFHETLKSSKDLTKEKRDDLIKNFREANAEKHKALKAAQKELQKKIRETKQEGARRK
jgi:hypothetical protein